MASLPIPSFSVVLKKCRRCPAFLTAEDISCCRRCKDRKNIVAKRRRRKDPEYQRRHNRAYAKKRRMDPEYNKKMADWRKQRVIDKLCRQCSESALEDDAYCAFHALQKKQYAANYRKKKQATK